MTDTRTTIDPDQLGSVTHNTVLFLGVSTQGSRIYQERQHILGLLGREDVQVLGVDVPRSASIDDFAGLIATMRATPAILGAIITDHKLRTYEAAAGSLTDSEFGATVMGEVNTLRTQGTSLIGFARDPFAIENALAHQGPHPDSIMCLGCGGAARSLLLAAALDLAASMSSGAPVLRSRTPTLIFTDIRERAASELAHIAAAIGVTSIETHVVSNPKENSDLLDQRDVPTLVVNASALGKFDDRSPLTADPERRQRHRYWDFNYRGPLPFLSDARRAGAEAVDGRQYYKAGWATGLGAILGLSAAEALSRSQLSR